MGPKTAINPNSQKIKPFMASSFSIGAGPPQGVNCVRAPRQAAAIILLIRAAAGERYRDWDGIGQLAACLSYKHLSFPSPGAPSHDREFTTGSLAPRSKSAPDEGRENQTGGLVVSTRHLW